MFTQRVDDDKRVTDTLSEQLVPLLAKNDASEIFRVTKDLCQDGTKRILILDPDGIVQVDTLSTLNGSRFSNFEIEKVLQGESVQYGFYTDSVNHWVATAFNTFLFPQTITDVYVTAIKQTDALAGIIVYISDAVDICSSLRRMQMRILIWLVIVAVAVTLLSIILIRMITRPIGDLREGIARMSAGELSVRINVRGRNEFSELAEAFNKMSERIELLDQSRSQFVSNASHELKTPLSTIKIMTESILYQDEPDPQMTKEFLKDVNSEIDRLNRIVTDLLTLVKIDSGSAKLERQRVDIGELLSEQIRRLAPLARENGIELDLESNVKDAVYVDGDALKLQQVLYNVIDNAIKYTARGGEVSTSIGKSGKKIIIRIKDTGIGIPEKDLPHIFERFYRVDRARSRATGGTGLGLSIVQQIVIMHGGSIMAESKEGEGTCFTIELPSL